MSNLQPALGIDAAPGPDAYLIRVRGELDLGGCPDLELALGEAEQTRARQVILDLEELTFIDSTGLETLLEASRRSAVNGNRLQITRSKGHVADMFRLTALDKTLPLTDPALCPAIEVPGAAPGSRSNVKRSSAIQRSRLVHDNANRPLTGEQFVHGRKA